MILAQSDQVPRRSSALLRREKGLRSLKNITHTARMAPSWITTRNMSQKSLLVLSLTNSPTSSMWPVLETGSHSVMPSTRPKNAALSSSMMSKTTSLTRGTCTPHDDGTRGGVLRAAPLGHKTTTAREKGPIEKRAGESIPGPHGWS